MSWETDHSFSDGQTLRNNGSVEAINYTFPTEEKKRLESDFLEDREVDGNSDPLYPKINRVDYLLTPCSRVLLEKPTGSQLVKKFPAFYGTQSFISAFTSASHLSLS